MKRCCWLLLGLVVAAPLQAATERSAFRAMGTVVEVTVRDDDPAVRRAALDTARRLFERYGREWYPWHEDSELARVNRALAEGRTAEASPELLELLHDAGRLSCLAGGRFNPAIGGLVELWGFHRPPPYEDPAPDAAAIERWRQGAPAPADLRLADSTVASSNPAVRLDLGAIAKGAIIDRALAAMRDAGLEHAMINAGGDMAVIGNAGGRPWRAAIRHPEAGLLATIELASGEALFTSGDYERFRETGDGRRLGHVLDPRTGRPARGAVQASVIAAGGTRADAAATALLIADDDEWTAVVASMDVAHVLRMPSASVLQMDAGLHARLELVDPSMQVAEKILPPAPDHDCD